jgi:hypothetical protein
MKKVMMKGLLLALPAVLMMSCKPTMSVSTDYDRSANFSTYKSFSLYYLVTNKNVNQLNEQRIWNAIREEMKRKGYSENDRNPDLLVNAVSVVKNKQYLSVTSNSYGYGGVYRPYGYWGAGAGRSFGTGTVQEVNYKDGSLMIDVLDARTKKLIWEGTVSAEINKQPKNPEEAVQKAVSKVMSGFPAGNATN